VLTVAKLSLANDHTITLGSLTIGGSTVNDATVTYTLKDASGTTVTSGTLSASGSGGNYTAQLESSAITSISDGGQYTLTATVVSGSNNGEFNLTLRAGPRGSS
jgi:flagellar basal-body rod modification protein FlgD